MTKAFSHERATDGKEEWLTPPEIIKSLGQFDLDPCSPIKRPWDTALNHYNINDNGLSQEWSGRVWCNPPYGTKTNEWLRKLSKHGNGIALVFARTETKMFFENIWPKASCICFLKGRIAFYHVTGVKSKPAVAPSCLIGYGEENVKAIDEAIKNKQINGKLILLNN